MTRQSVPSKEVKGVSEMRNEFSTASGSDIEMLRASSLDMVNISRLEQRTLSIESDVGARRRPGMETLGNGVCEDACETKSIEATERNQRRVAADASDNGPLKPMSPLTAPGAEKVVFFRDQLFDGVSSETFYRWSFVGKSIISDACCSLCATVGDEWAEPDYCYADEELIHLVCFDCASKIISFENEAFEEYLNLFNPNANIRWVKARRINSTSSKDVIGHLVVCSGGKNHEITRRMGFVDVSGVIFEFNLSADCRAINIKCLTKAGDFISISRQHLKKVNKNLRRKINELRRLEYAIRFAVEHLQHVNNAIGDGSQVKDVLALSRIASVVLQKGHKEGVQGDDQTDIEIMDPNELKKVRSKLVHTIGKLYAQKASLVPELEQIKQQEQLSFELVDELQIFRLPAGEPQNIFGEILLWCPERFLQNVPVAMARSKASHMTKVRHIKFLPEQQKFTLLYQSMGPEDPAQFQLPQEVNMHNVHVVTATHGKKGGHTGPVVCVAPLPDHTGAFVSGGADNELRVWTKGKGKTVVLKGHRAPVYCVKAAHRAWYGGKTGASDVDDKTLRRLNPNAEAGLLGRTPSGTVIVSGSNDKCVRIWDAATGVCESELRGHTKEISALLLLNDGRIASGSFDGTIRIWGRKDTASAPTVAASSEDALVAGMWECHYVLAGHADSVFGLELLSKETLTKADPVKTVQAVQSNLTTRHVITTVEPNVRFASSSKDGTIRIWTSYKEDRVLKGHGDAVFALCATSFYAVENGADTYGQNVGQEHEDGEGEKKTVLTTDELVLLPENPEKDPRDGAAALVSKRFTRIDDPRSIRLISGAVDGSLRVWDIDTGTCLAVLDEHSDGVTCIVSLDNGRFASASLDRTIRVWNNLCQCEATLKGHSGGVSHLSVSFDPVQRELQNMEERGSTTKRGEVPRLISSSFDQSIRLWTEQGTDGDEESSIGIGMGWVPLQTVLGHESAVFGTAVLGSATSSWTETDQDHAGGLVPPGRAVQDRLSFASCSGDGSLRVWTEIYVPPTSAASSSLPKNGSVLASTSQK